MNKMSIKLKNSYVFAVFLLLFLSACSNQLPKSDAGNAGTVTLEVGESMTCYTVGSCTVYLIMPEAPGEYTVKQDGPAGRWTAGTFPAQGQSVLLGKFYGGRTRFIIQGMDAPDTWVTVVSH